ncbi:hypothetical protein QR721_03950 [Aciduricibacillus chroicocephali]|uniref:Uncharacterized protein n=1 Tax=Aciduricibacillus chroicocephali TaxID=3054939 RepID=A0ABY9KX82_9BACI|nr:hypothetical protein QR721_03950 [Bacillaceae bacterium 44XB]
MEGYYGNQGDLEVQALLAKARHSGLSYNEAKLYIAMTTGGRGTEIYSDTNVEEVRRQNETAEQTNVKFGQNN